MNAEIRLKTEFPKVYEWIEKLKKETDYDTLNQLKHSLNNFKPISRHLISQQRKLVFEVCLHYANQGHAFFSYLCSVFFSGRWGVPRNDQKCFLFASQAADANDCNGLSALGVCHLIGAGTPKDFGKAKELFEKSSKLGSPIGTFNLGSFYFYSPGSPEERNESKAFELYQSVSEKNPEAMSAVAISLEQGFGVKSNPQKAKEFLKKAVEMGSDSAMHNLALTLRESSPMEAAQLEGLLEILDQENLENQKEEEEEEEYVDKEEVKTTVDFESLVRKEREKLEQLLKKDESQSGGLSMLEMGLIAGGTVIGIALLVKMVFYRH